MTKEVNDEAKWMTKNINDEGKKMTKEKDETGKNMTKEKDDKGKDDKVNDVRGNPKSNGNGRSGEYVS